MKRTVLFSAIGMLSAWSSVAGAQEIGRVLSSTPVIQQIAVPRQVCSYQPVTVQQPNTGTGGVVGALAGGAIGNQIGHGDGRAAATVLGLVGGALLGNQIERNNSAPQVQNMQSCTTQTQYENRTVGYNVVYEYAGKQYNVQMPYDPGPTIRLQVTPMSGNMPSPDADAASAAPVQTQTQPSGVIVAPPMAPARVGQPVAQIIGVPSPVATYPAYPAYYSSPSYYPPIGISLGIGYSRHSHRWR